MPEVTLQDDSMTSQGLHHYALLLSLLISMEKTKSRPLSIQSTPDNSNLLEKLTKVRVIGSSEQIVGNREMGWGMNASNMYLSWTTWLLK